MLSGAAQLVVPTRIAVDRFPDPFAWRLSLPSRAAHVASFPNPPPPFWKSESPFADAVNHKTNLQGNGPHQLAFLQNPRLQAARSEFEINGFGIVHGGLVHSRLDLSQLSVWPTINLPLQSATSRSLPQAPPVTGAHRRQQQVVPRQKGLSSLVEESHFHRAP